MMRSAVRSVLAVLVAILLLCSMALAVGGGVAGAGAAAAGSITGQTAAPSKPQPAETNQPSAAVAESPTEAGSEDASDDGETSNGGIFARIAEFFRTLLEPRKDSGEMVEKTFGEIRDAINFGFNTVENTLRDSGNFPFIDGSAVVGAIANVMLPIGLLVFLICWSLQVMRSGLELELYEVKHFIKLRAGDCPQRSRATALFRPPRFCGRALPQPNPCRTRRGTEEPLLKQFPPAPSTRL